MKLQDKETLNIANTVKDVLERKTVKEIKYPHKMYSPEGEEVTAKNKEEHEAYVAKGYTHDKPVKEVEEPQPKGEKELKAKHPVKKSGSTEDGKVVKEEKDPDSDGIDPDSDGVDKQVKEVSDPLEDIITSPGTGMETAQAEMLEGPVIRLDEPLEEEEKEVEESEKQKKYQAFFQKALKKFGVKSPAELEGEKKKEFFDYVDKNYDAEGE